ncbi:hypothetical protein TNCV_1194851, partial [Trichonephila clavipes]
MIPILKRFCDSFYMVLVDDKTLPAFLTEYVFNCPERTSIEFQVSKYYQEDPEDSEDEDCPTTVTPDVLLDILTTIINPIVNMYNDGDCVHIRTSPPEDVGYPEEFSTVGYIEMKHTQNSRFEGKMVYRSLLDLPHLCDEYCNHTPPPDNVDTFSDNLQEEDSSEVSSDIASNNMNVSLDTSDTKPLEDSSNLLVASKNVQMYKVTGIIKELCKQHMLEDCKLLGILLGSMSTARVIFDHVAAVRPDVHQHILHIIQPHSLEAILELFQHHLEQSVPDLRRLNQHQERLPDFVFKVLFRLIRKRF